MGASATTWARVGVVALAGAVIAVGAVARRSAPPVTATARATTTTTTTTTPTTTTGDVSTTTTVVVPSTAAPTTTPPSGAAWGVGEPWGTAVEGLLTFRGNPTRSYHGGGPVPAQPTIRWRYPQDSRMCSLSTEYHETRQWCGTGWTGQPAVFERAGRTWVVFGAYDAAFHFVDAATGADLLPPLPTGDLAKGAVTVDPDGFPLVYAGSRDNLLRVIAIDRAEPEVLWSLDARTVGPTFWNDDWDGAPLLRGDFLVEGGENSRLHVVRLHRGYAADGSVTASPELVWSAPGWDDQLLADLGDHRVSLESSVTMLGDVVYVANSGGLVQGWDLAPLFAGTGEPRRVLRFWTGDDTDATIVADQDGYLYVGAEVDRATARGRELGQLLKLDPTRPDDPLVWSVDVNRGTDSGTWSTAAVVGDLVIWPTKPGRVYAVERASGTTRWTLDLPGPVLGSPTVVDGVLLLGDSAGILHAYDLGDGTSAPLERWAVTLGGTIESTAAVWRGGVYVGTRDGRLFALGDA